MDGITHRVAEERSLALHREVARRVLADPRLLEPVRERVKRWQLEGTVSTYWAQAWAEVLERSPDGIAEAITDPTEHGRSLRQSTPFAGVIDSKTRWQILRACERDRRARDQGSA